MKKFKAFSEARKNPEVNVRKDPFKALEPYAEDPYAFISFRTAVNTDELPKWNSERKSASEHRARGRFKLGINPKSPYKTPNGIYSYPVEPLWDFMESEQSVRGLPFRADAPAFYLFRYVGPKDGIIFLSKLNQDMVEGFIEERIIGNPSLQSHFIRKDQVAYIKQQEQYLDVVKRIYELKKEGKGHGEIAGTIRNLFDNDKYPDITPYKEDSLMALTARELSTIKSILDSTTFQLNKMKKDDEITAKNIYRRGTMEGRHRSAGGVFWWVMWKLSNDNPNRWNKMFREFDIYGVVDDAGNGIIHGNEPTQAVFFDATKLKTEEVIVNYEDKREGYFPFTFIGFLKKIKAVTKITKRIPEVEMELKKTHGTIPSFSYPANVKINGKDYEVRFPKGMKGKSIRDYNIRKLVKTPNEELRELWEEIFNFFFAGAADEDASIYEMIDDYEQELEDEIEILQPVKMEKPKPPPVPKLK